MRVTNPYDFRPALLYAATTDSQIPWEWITQSRSPELFMTERERVEVLLKAVNGESVAVREWSRLCGAPLKGGPLILEGSSWNDQRVPLVAQARQALRAALEGFVREPDAAAPEILANAAVISDGRVLRVMELSEDGVPRDRVIAHSIGAALIFALSIALDRDRPYRRLLRQCEWPECGRFAFVTPPELRGQPPNFYCSGEHRLSHRREQSRQRQAAYRAGVSVGKFRKMRRRKP
jgi:hypothetical protein